MSTNDIEKPEEGGKVVIDRELKITPGTIARTIILALALINQFLVFFGKPIIRFDSAGITELVANVWTLAAAVAAWWKNNSFTLPARVGDAVMRALREGKMEDEDGAD